MVGLVGLGLFAASMMMGRREVIRRDWLAPGALFGVVFGVYFVLRPAVLLAGLEPVTAGRQGIWGAIVLGFVVVAGFWMGYLLPLGEAVARGLPWASRSWPKQRARTAVWLSWGLGVASWGVMIYHSGGVVARMSAYGQGVGKGLGVVVVASAVLLGMPRLQFAGSEQVALGPGDYAIITGWLVARNLTAFDSLMLVAQRVPGEVGYQWGRSYVDAIKMVVPRWLYAEKPQRNLFNRALRPGSTGSMALSLPAEGYLNFGLAGLLAETLVLGIAYRAAYSYRQRHPGSEPAILGYALAVPVFGLLWRGGFMGGGLAHLIGYGAVAIGIVLFCSGPRWVVAKGK